MMVNARGLIALLVITTFLFSSGCTRSSPAVTPTLVSTPAAPVSPAFQSATRADLVAFVQSAAAYAKTNGKERALAEFDKRNSSFFKGELYIYAYDYDGTTIAHPVNPEKIGVNRLGERDAYGNLFIQDLRQAAYNGSGFSEYYYINPVHNNAIEKKLGYVMRVDDSWWLGSGIYEGPFITTPSLPPVHSPARSRDDLTLFVQNAKAYALLYGKDRALKEFNNRTGAFVNGELYIFAYTYDGTTLALPFQPELLGVNRMGMTDADGIPYIREMAHTARGGSGFVDYSYPDPSASFTVKKKTSYVVDVDGTWFIGSGLYAGS